MDRKTCSCEQASTDEVNDMASDEKAQQLVSGAAICGAAFIFVIYRGQSVHPGLLSYETH